MTIAYILYSTSTVAIVDALKTLVISLSLTDKFVVYTVLE